MRKKCKRHVAPYLPPNRYTPVDSAVVAHHWATVWLQWGAIRTGDVYERGHPSYEVIAATLIASGYVLNNPRLKPNKTLDHLRNVVDKAQLALYHLTKRSLAEESSGDKGAIRFKFLAEEPRAIERAFVAFEGVHALLPATDWALAYKAATARVKSKYTEAAPNKLRRKGFMIKNAYGYMAERRTAARSAAERRTAARSAETASHALSTPLDTPRITTHKVVMRGQDGIDVVMNVTKHSTGVRKGKAECGKSLLQTAAVVATKPPKVSATKAAAQTRIEKTKAAELEWARRFNECKTVIDTYIAHSNPPTKKGVLGALRAFRKYSGGFMSPIDVALDVTPNFLLRMLAHAPKAPQYDAIRPTPRNRGYVASKVGSAKDGGG